MALSTEAIVAIIGLVVTMPSAIVIVRNWNALRRRRRALEATPAPSQSQGPESETIVTPLPQGLSSEDKNAGRESHLVLRESST
jgi:hypothetical protein